MSKAIQTSVVWLPLVSLQYIKMTTADADIYKQQMLGQKTILYCAVLDKCCILTTYTNPIRGDRINVLLLRSHATLLCLISLVHMKKQQSKNGLLHVYNEMYKMYFNIKQIVFTTFTTNALPLFLREILDCEIFY